VPDQDTNSTAGTDDRPSWDLYRRMAESPHVSLARRQATLWALGELEQRMGPDWLERYWDRTGHVPEEVNLGGAHVGALGSLLDFALRLQLLDGAPGAASVQREMKRDLRDDRRRHSALQHEVAALAVRAGFSAALEDRSGGQGAPSDVLLRRGPHAVRVETFAVIPDERFREERAYWDRVMARIRSIDWQYDVSVAGDLGGHLGDIEAAELLQRIAAAAQAVADTGQERPVAFGGAQLRVLPPGTTGYELRGGVQTSQGWPRVERRLLQKAAQAARAGGGWLRVDLMDGTWQFTPWARASLREKVDQIAELLKPALCQVGGITGVVASSGACVAQGQFHGESARTPDHCYGFVRPLPGARVRETMIVPVSPGGRDEADLWAGLYNSEDSWLDWALGQARLPGCRQVFGR
jgi:hypothetical protein